MELLGMREFTHSDKKKPAAPRVLVVDDEALIRWSVSETLTDFGCSVVEAGNAFAAKAAVATDRFDVVLLDFRLPDSDDLSLLASIRLAMPDAQVIMMTAFGRPDVVEGALELGAYRVINKPFEMDVLADLVAGAYAARSYRSRPN